MHPAGRRILSRALAAPVAGMWAAPGGAVGPDWESGYDPLSKG